MNVPAGYTALDLVGFTDKGIYSSSANYVQNDIVHYGGDMWRCLIDDTTNIAPSEGLNWTLWIGEPTNLTEAIIAPLEVSPATDAHSVGDQLIFNDVLYKVISAISIGDSLTVGTNIEAARKIVYQISGIESDIATIEPTSIASKNYAVGEYMFYGWEFYRVTMAITAGDTIVTTGAGQNVTEVTVGDELTLLNSGVASKVEKAAVTTQAVETIGSTAVEGHDVYSYFLATDGNYYKATAAIVIGDTLTVNTNCIRASIADVQSCWHVVATSTGSKTWSAHISDLINAFKALSGDLRAKSFIRTSGTVIYRCSHIGRGIFNNTDGSSTAITTSVIRMNADSATPSPVTSYCQMKSNGTIEFVDRSNDTINATFELIY